MFNNFFKPILGFINILWISFLILMIIVLHSNAKLTCLFLFMCIIVSSYPFWIRFIKNKNFDIKLKIRLPLIVVLFILSGISTPTSESSNLTDKQEYLSSSESLDSTNKQEYLIAREHESVNIEDIQTYEFGDELLKVLNQIGIYNLGESIFEVVNEHTITIRMNIDDAKIWIALDKGYYDENWNVSFVKDYNNKEYVYYLSDENKYVNGLLK